MRIRSANRVLLVVALCWVEGIALTRAQRSLCLFLFDGETVSLHGGQMMAQRSNPQDEKRGSPLDGILVILITLILSVVLVAMLLNLFLIVI